MPNPAPQLTSRRAFLRGSLALAGIGVVGTTGLAGCDVFQSPQPDPTVSPELDQLLTNTVALGHRYDTTIAAVPDLKASLTPLRDTHCTHAEALASAIGRTVPSPSAGSATPSDRRSALVDLSAAEKAGQAEATTVCLATDARLAPLLGSIAAARATHQEVLT